MRRHPPTNGLLEGGSLTGPSVLTGLPPAQEPFSIRRLIALALVPLLLLLLLWHRSHDDPAATVTPTTIQTVHLVGARGPDCLRVVIADDVSGSMRNYASSRELAVRALLGWIPKNLRADDEIAVADFAQDAGTRLAPTQVGDLTASTVPGTASARDGTYTWLQPLLGEIDGWPVSQCDVALLLFSDAQVVLDAEAGPPTLLPSDEAGGRSLARSHHLHAVRLLVPDPDIEVPPTWVQGFPEAAPLRFHGRDADETARAVAQAIAGLTGQQLEHR
jgi:hypothetical protein